jgi:gamma-glutamylcyclotransferase (GGCT)/AIG2-like uncharacterized protein YtfP
VNNLTTQNAINIGKGEFDFPDIILFDIGFDLIFVHDIKLWPVKVGQDNYYGLNYKNLACTRLIRTSAYLCFYYLMETTSTYLFVYGTLLQPANEYARYLNTHCKLIRPAKFKGRLYDIGEYPGAIADANTDNYVYGSIFFMDDTAGVLQVLDDYEGIGPADPLPHEYTRQLFNVETDNGFMNCWIYFYALPIDQYYQILSGNYNQYLSNPSI